MESIPARVHAPSDPVPPWLFERFGGLKTWGEVLAKRTARQDPPLPFTGTTVRPRLPREKKK
jgi:filamentous hemagglutinin